MPDMVLHKLTDPLTCRVFGLDSHASGPLTGHLAAIEQLQCEHPEVVIMDSLESVTQVLSRNRLYRSLAISLETFAHHNILIPEWFYFEADELSLDALKAGIPATAFPLSMKTLFCKTCVYVLC